MEIVYKDFKIKKDGVNYVLVKGEKEKVEGYFTSVKSALVRIFVRIKYEDKNNPKPDNELMDLIKSHKLQIQKLYILSQKIYNPISIVKKEIYGV